MKSKRWMLLTCKPPGDRRCKRHIVTLHIGTLTLAYSHCLPDWPAQLQATRRFGGNKDEQRRLKNACREKEIQTITAGALVRFLLIFGFSISFGNRNGRASPLRSEDFLPSSEALSGGSSLEQSPFKSNFKSPLAYTTCKLYIFSQWRT